MTTMLLAWVAGSCLMGFWKRRRRANFKKKFIDILLVKIYLSIPVMSQIDN